MNGKTHTPLIQVSKRETLPWQKSWLIRGIAIVAALIVCALITTMLTGENPIQVYGSMVSGAFGTGRRIWQLLRNVAILLTISLAVTPAFKMRFWNVGAEGQVMAGALACTVTMLYLGDKLPNALLILVMLIASVAAGALWAFIPAFFKAKWNTNETLFTLMMNYIATQLIAFFIVWKYPNGTGTMGIVNQDTRAGWLPRLGGNEFILIILVSVVITALMYVYLNYTKHGYELSVVGESERTARYVGIKVGKVVLRTLILSGAVCGIVGFLLVAGVHHSISTNIAGGQGFTAVMVSWLAHFNPIMMVFSSFLLCFLGQGADQISTDLGLDHAFGDILTGVILFFIIGSEFFINYKIKFRSGEERKGEIENA